MKEATALEKAFSQRERLSRREAEAIKRGEDVETRIKRVDKRARSSKPWRKRKAS